MVYPLLHLGGRWHRSGAAESREHLEEAVHADYVPPKSTITANYDPTDRGRAMEYLRTKQQEGEYVTDMLYIDPNSQDFHAINETTGTPLNQLSYNQLNPDKPALDKILSRYY